MWQCFVVFRWLHHAFARIWHNVQVVQELNMTPFILFIFFTTPFVLFNFSKTQTSSCLACIFWNLTYLYSLKPKFHLIKYFLLWNLTSQLVQLSELKTSSFHSFSLKPHHFSSYSIFWNPNSISSFIFSKTPPFVLFKFLKPKCHLLLHLF